jgi:hypothetical protein
MKKTFYFFESVLEHKGSIYHWLMSEIGGCMANYIPTCRSNYFQVKDLAAFTSWCIRLNLNWDHENGKSNGPVMIYPDMDGESSWPCFFYDDNGEEHDIDFEAELAEHLLADEVAIIMEVGHEKLRYLCGFATAIRKGKEPHEYETLTVSLNDIYQRVEAEWGNQNVSTAEY